MRKQELVHMNGLMEEIAAFYAREEPDIVARYLDDQDIDLNSAPYATREEDELFEAYFHDAGTTESTRLDARKPAHEASLRFKLDELVAFSRYKQNLEAYGTDQDELIPSADD